MHDSRIGRIAAGWLLRLSENFDAVSPPALRRWGRIAWLAFVGGLLPLTLSGQSYGIGDQTLTVGAAAFRGINHQPVFQADGYLYNADPNDNGSAFFAPFRLPAGAVVMRLCAYLRNEEPDPSATPFFSIQAVRMWPGGADGVSPVYFPYPSFNSGYAESCTDEFAYVFHDDRDVDADGSSDHVTHRLFLGMGAGATVGLGGARIFWRRQVSPAPAQPTFGDVATGHPFFQYIEALAASAITGGCGNGNFCPDANLTRGQMAVFLAKALGLHWVN